MKKIFTLLMISFLALNLTMAQERYVDEIFTDVEVRTEIYGANATVLFLPVAEEAIQVPLPMDIYTPVGDTETDRPVVLVFHTGNFLPSVTNGQIPGTRVDSSAVEICTQLARRGYVAASCDYRLGWNPLAGTQPERALGLIQAAYRGLQDGRNAVRYMRANAEPLGIDSEKITVFGLGTGGYLVLGMVSLDDYNELLTTTNGPAKFFLDADGDGAPDTPMVIEAFHGDVNGEVLTVTPADGSSIGFGLPPGDTTNYSNIPGVSNDFALSVNIGGALGDISWLDDNTTPIISVQSPFDIFAPYGDDVLIVPTTGDPIVQVQGASIIGLAQQENGANSVFTADDIVFDDAVTQMAIDNSATAGHDYYEGVFPYIMPPNSNGIDEGVVVDWWDENAPSPADGQGMGIPWNQLPHPSGGTFHDQGIILNEGMSAEKARANIALSMEYILPRMCVALDLPCKANYTISSTEEVLSANEFSVYPNPAQDFLMVNSNGKVIQEVILSNLKGQVVIHQTNINNQNYKLISDNINTGMYILQVRFEDGLASQKVMFE